MRDYHLIPDETNLLRADYREDIFPEIVFSDLSKVDPAEKKEARIKGYRNVETMRGFKKEEVPLRITQFRMGEDKSELLITWDARYLSETAVNWLIGEWNRGSQG